ncbi:MAG: hypothetical protein ACYSTF_08825, partial [Planctomycetota bacterium]
TILNEDRSVWRTFERKIGNFSPKSKSGQVNVVRGSGDGREEIGLVGALITTGSLPTNLLATDLLGRCLWG